jgi:hypothetical protein
MYQRRFPESWPGLTDPRSRDESMIRLSRDAEEVAQPTELAAAVRKSGSRRYGIIAPELTRALQRDVRAVGRVKQITHAFPRSES